MLQTICIYEDEKCRQFYPLTHLRPVYLMRPGILPLYQRVEQHFGKADLTLLSRNQIAPLLAEQVSQCPVNTISRGDGAVLFINGRIRNYGDLAKLAQDSDSCTSFVNGGETVAVLFQPSVLGSIPSTAPSQAYTDLYRSKATEFSTVETSAVLYNYCWEIMADIKPAIEQDFKSLGLQKASGSAIVHEGAHLVNDEQICLGDGVEVLPGSVIDASGGPVFIGQNTKVESHAAIYGTSYVGPDSIVMAGKITASSIGNCCRVGGEVEESIFQSYVNKYHAGFIGHSYVGSWVNFGAMTTNSDLKNNYSNIRVSLNGEGIDTGSIKVGSFIGDHTKFGIGTLLNTGINIGVCCNIYGGTLVVEREVPSFSWGNSANWVQYRFDKAIETAQRTCDRRRQPLSPNEIEILKAVSESTSSDDGVVTF
jgi:UDP-N-acetylglucosamine diphosphorylase/glucosamine-1-phosphate N-acetyltransferase